MVTHLKNEIRKQILAKRNALSKDEIEKLSDKILERLLSHPKFPEAKIVAFYMTKGSEVDTKKMIERAIKEGKQVLVPVTGQKIAFYKFQSFDDLVQGKFGIMEPKSKDTPFEQCPDIIIVPGVTFGLCMHRLGYGKGYYDRYLSDCKAFRIGICFDFQIIDKLPVHENDQRMNCIITDKRTIQ
ncbi:5-formyltetrahydrofolate cyclo-ligase family protein [Candidatus Bilamarchaeum dharawalense]|uniref:5-formyltetrahydrofolate cyclo-ligase family protein n=1 Tax=Candidatus Bilamarchaeum dharawalense TaxID=2885759 RepID=A0A5E4LRW8_9ARCH|nr:5-formyltetrahydrofolate cyclo-ligase family protein [Candidatus Bilamarchaeum dharawalense]